MNHCDKAPAPDSHPRDGAGTSPLDCLYRVNAAVHALPEDVTDVALLEAACEALTAGGIFHGCWLGVPRADGGMDYLAVAGAEMPAYLDDVQIRVDDTPEGRGPVGRAWRSGEPVVIADWRDDPAVGPWVASAARHGGWRAVAAFPIHRGGKPWGIWGMYANRAGAFDERTSVLGRLTADTLGRELDWREALRQAAGHRALYRALGAMGELVCRGTADTQNAILAAACEILAESALFSAAWLQRPNAERWFETLAHAGLRDELAESLHCNVEQHPDLVVSRAWREEKLQHVARTGAAPAVAKKLRQLGWGGIVVAPVRRGRRLWALLCVVTNPNSDFHAESVTLVERLAEQIGHTLDHHDNTRALNESRAFYAVLANANDSVRRNRHSRDEERLLDAFCTAVADAELFDRVFVATPRASGGMELRPETTRPSSAHSETIIDAARQVALMAWDSKQFVFCDDIRAEPSFAPVADDLTAVGWQGHAAVPVHRGDSAWGVLTVVFPAPRGLRPEARRLLQRLGGLLSAALEEMDEQRALEVARSRDRWLATHDALTGIRNRSVADAVLPRAIARGRRAGTGVAVAYLDLDGFKEINDRDGHRQGDEILRRVAQRALSGLRSTDTLVRWGGDEFLCILEGLGSAEEAAAPTQRLLDAIGQPVHLDGREFEISCSCGVAMFPGDADEADALIRCADVALYAHKTRKNDPGRVPFVRYGRESSGAFGDSG